MVDKEILNFFAQTFADLKKLSTFATANSNAKVAQLVEHNLAKVRVAGSSPVFRSQEGIQNVLGTLFNYTDMTLKFIST